MERPEGAVGNGGHARSTHAAEWEVRATPIEAGLRIPSTVMATACAVATPATVLRFSCTPRPASTAPGAPDWRRAGLRGAMPPGGGVGSQAPPAPSTERRGAPPEPREGA